MKHQRMKKEIKRVAVIGAGASGLQAIRWLRDITYGTKKIDDKVDYEVKDDGTETQDAQDAQKIVAFEQQSQIGGTWIYSPSHGPDLNANLSSIEYDGNDYTMSTAQQSQHSYSAIYESLRTNLPHKLMAFSDFEFRTGTPMFPRHEAVLQYLQDYAQTFDLLKYIRFNTRVNKVDWNDQQQQWRVTTSSCSSPNDGAQVDVDSEEVHWFDAVIVANGHYYKPLIPSIQGFTEFPGRILHSHDYRTPHDFQSQHVLVIGGGSSGIDIARELQSYASKVYISLRDPNSEGDIGETIDTQAVTTASTTETSIQESNRPIPPVMKKPEVDHLDNQGNVYFVDDPTKAHKIDTIIVATGYLYDFPFLDPKLLSRITDGMGVDNLHHHILFKDNPTLAFIGLPIKVVPFPLIEIQAKWVANVFKHQVTLPEEAFCSKSDPEAQFDRKALVLRGVEFEYCDQLAMECGVNGVEPWRRELRQRVFQLRRDFLKNDQV